MGRISKQKRQLIEEANKRLLNEVNEVTISSIVHSDVDDFVDETINRFYDVCEKIEDDLQKLDIQDDGFVFHAQQKFIPEMMNLASEFIHEIKHGIHHHEEMEDKKKYGPNSSGSIH